MNDNQDYANYHGHPEPDTVAVTVENRPSDSFVPPAPHTAPTETLVAAKKQGRSRMEIGAIIVIVLLGAIAGYFGSQLLDTATEPPQITASTAIKPPVVKQSTATQAIKLVATTLGTDMSEDKLSAPYIKVSGNKFHTQLSPVDTAGSVQATSSEASVASLATKVRDALKAINLEEKSISLPGSQNELSMYFYTNTLTICSLTVSNGQSKDSTIAASCADKAKYTELAAKQKPLFAAYEARPSTTQDAGEFVLQDYTSTKSVTDGYTLATTNITPVGSNIGNALGMFYQSPDKSWHYFQTSQGITPCDDFKTPDLKKVYAGTDCSDRKTGTLTKVVAQ